LPGSVHEAIWGKPSRPKPISKLASAISVAKPWFHRHVLDRGAAEGQALRCQPHHPPKMICSMIRHHPVCDPFCRVQIIEFLDGKK
jgi:hypothetical protein